MPDVAYILGHSPAEIGRLIFQAGVLKPITERLLREAGVAPGMRVLDLGCGTGDVALLVAELVGPNGAVVGIDRNGDVLTVAGDTWFRRRPSRRVRSASSLSFGRAKVESWVTRTKKGP
jgi:cyclopropane fatty-acyl-phospholipid synthase-like methyltransferase